MRALIRIVAPPRVTATAATSCSALGGRLACGGLVAPNGTISLLRTTTLAAYHDGVEHYITSFSYAGKMDGSLGVDHAAARACRRR